uniref:Uncharacterized protein n=1 Tax=Rhizophora mucronata TaxID=61149 RepID=A0A2P2NVB1_RHIMU
MIVAFKKHFLQNFKANGVIVNGQDAQNIWELLSLNKTTHSALYIHNDL